jgi:hypothetical protein
VQSQPDIRGAVPQLFNCNKHKLNEQSLLVTAGPKLCRNVYKAKESVFGEIIVRLATEQNKLVQANDLAEGQISGLDAQNEYQVGFAD